MSNDNSAQAESNKPITIFESDMQLNYHITAGKNNSVFLNAVKQGKLLGTRDPYTGKVYIPPRGPVPTNGMMMHEFVEVADRGTVCTFCTVDITFPGQELPVPYVGAWILLDGSDIPFMHIVGDIEASKVRMGMRVQAVWRPKEQWQASTSNIKYFKPSGEPDAPYETYKDHV